MIPDDSSNKREVFARQAKLMIQASDLLDLRITQISPADEDKDLIDDGEDVVRLFAMRSLRYYADTLRFLAGVLNEYRFEWCRFLLPNARMLNDVYARFLHLVINCESADKRALTCIAYQLLSYKVLGDSVYQKSFDMYSNYLKRVKPDFPKDVKSFSKRWVEKNGLHFFDNASLLTKNNIAAHSVDVTKVFGADKTYEIYSHFSGLLHGDPYRAGGKGYREEYWLVSTSIINSAFLIELIDREFLDHINPRDFRDWLKCVKDAKPELVAVWTAQ